MKLKVFNFGILFLLFSNIIRAEYIPADAVLYNKVMAKVNEIEIYSHFLATEKTSIKNIDDVYYKLRWDYLVDVASVNPNVASPQIPLGIFIDACKSHGYLLSTDTAFPRAANILGYELITGIAPKFRDEGINFSVQMNLPYVTNDGYSQKLDMYLPLNIKKESPVPCVIFIHGGAWTSHKRAWLGAYCRYFANKGYAAVTIDYRMLNAVTPLECAHDAKAAVRWVRANAALYGIDPKRIGGCGDSAGAALIAMLATTADIAELEGTGGNPGVSTRIQAAVGLSTPTLTGKQLSWPWKWASPPPAWYDMISAYKHITADDTPMMFLHGQDDTLVLPQDPQDMYDKYKSLGIYTEIEIIIGQGHNFYMSNVYAEKAFVFFKKNFEPSNTAVEQNYVLPIKTIFNNGDLRLFGLGLEDKITVFDVTGKTLWSGISGANEKSIKLNRGCYIVDVANSKAKFRTKVIN